MGELQYNQQNAEIGIQDNITDIIDELQVMKNSIDDLERQNKIAMFFAIIAIFLAIISALINLWFTSVETKKISDIEYDDKKYTIELNHSTMYSAISTITDNETGKKYLVIQTPNGTIAEDKETSERISSEDLK